MSAGVPRRVASGVYQIGSGMVNAFLVEDDDGLVLIDAGVQVGAERIGAGIHALGRAPQELRAVVITHLHGDHVGGLAAVKEHTGAEVWMHPLDAALLREGSRGRPLEAGPGLIRSLIVRVVGSRSSQSGEPIAVEHEIQDGETLPFAGLKAVHTPGHTAGHLALLLPRDGGVLFVGDAATNFGRLGVGPVYENIEEGGRSLERLSELDFETALFAHGRPLRPRAGERFRARFAQRRSAAAGTTS